MVRVLSLADLMQFSIIILNIASVLTATAHSPVLHTDRLPATLMVAYYRSFLVGFVLFYFGFF